MYFFMEWKNLCDFYFWVEDFWCIVLVVRFFLFFRFSRFIVFGLVCMFMFRFD